MWSQREEGVTKKPVRAEAPRLWEGFLGRVPGRRRDKRVGRLQVVSWNLHNRGLGSRVGSGEA